MQTKVKLSLVLATFFFSILVMILYSIFMDQIEKSGHIEKYALYNTLAIVVGQNIPLILIFIYHYNYQKE